MLVLGLVSLAVFMLLPFLTGFVSVADIPLIMSSQIQHLIHGSLLEVDDCNSVTDSNAAAVGGTPNGLIPQDLFHDLESLARETKQTVKNYAVEIYNQYVPYDVASYLSTSFEYWQSHSSYKVYKDNEIIINNILLVVVLAITLKVIISFLKLLFGSKRDVRYIPEEDPILDSDGRIDKRYTEFETMPLCSGKGEVEEELLAKSYDALKLQNSESVILTELSKRTTEFANGGIPTTNGHIQGDLSILDGSTPRQSTPDFSTSSSNSGLGSPLIVKSKKSYKNDDSLKSALGSLSSLSTTRSISPEDSFEKEERVVDKSLSKLNERDASDERPYTPSRLSVNSSLGYSPSKKLVFKNSMSILTSHHVSTAETTVGSISEEVVYSELTKSDDNEILTPLRNQL